MNIHKSRARTAVYKALRKGQLSKLPCETCNNPNSFAHHYLGYEEQNWLAIKWLCSTHHIQAHSGTYKEPNTEGIITEYVPELRRVTEKQRKIVRLLKKGRKPSDVAKETKSSYIYVWKIAKELK